MATNNETYPFDYVQTHMLALIASIMNNYGFTSTDVHNYINQTNNLQQSTESSPSRSRSESTHSTTSTPVVHNAHLNSLETPNEISDTESASETTHLLNEQQPQYAWTDGTNRHAWASESSDSDKTQALETASKKIYVAHRRAFRDALSRGTKICPRYKDCKDDNCQRFHVLEENLCPHAGDNNHCDDVRCDKIVIKTCRRGRGCPNKATCSFRH